MTRIAFIGDSHLGYRHRFKAQRLHDFAHAFEDAVDKALRERPDAIVFLGDLVHHSRPDPVSLRTAMRKLMEAAARCHVIVCIGNHEIEGHLGTTYSPIYGDVDENIHVLSTESPHCLLEMGGRSVCFHGFEYIRSRERAEEALKKIEAKGQENILCIHQAIEKYSYPYELSLSALRAAAPKFSLIMCGHIHLHREIKEVSDITPAWYCGSTERVSFNEAGNKTGFMLFDSDYRNPRFIDVESATMSHVRLSFKGTPQQANALIEETIRKDPAKLLKIDLNGEIEGDPLDIRRDWEAIAPERTILEVSVSSPSTHPEAHLERMELNEGLICEYFQKTGTNNPELLEKCLELFKRYAQ